MLLSESITQRREEVINIRLKNVIDFPKKVWLNNENAKNRMSRYPNPSERSRLVRDFWKLCIEPVWEQQESKLRVIQKLLPEVTVIRDMRVIACSECREI